MKTLLFLSLVGSALGLGLMLLRRRAGGRMGSAFFYWAWLLVLLRFALPLPGLVPAYERQTEPVPAARESYAPRQELVLPEREVPAENPAAENPAPVEVSKPEARKSIDWERLLRWEVLWLGGALLVIGRQSLGYLRFTRKLRSTLVPVNDAELRQYIGIKQRFKPELAKSRAVSTPMLLGLKDPLLVLPQREYSGETLHNILLHEFTHYRRGDVVLKWLTMLVFAFHWFNPLTRLFVRELDKVCELSCDERLLKTMDSRQKQSYGETLLELAGGRRLKSGTPATCLAMEKHVLKERLEQIMKYKNKGKWGLVAMLLSLAVLAGCAVAAGPDTTPEVIMAPETKPAANDRQGVKVYNVDEFLAAIEPGANIVLAEGTFNLSEAKNYGLDSDFYSWSAVGDGYELQLHKVDGLSITGAGMGKSSLVTEPREANVLYFDGGEDISLAGFTAGHTEEPGHCRGGVLYLDGLRNLDVDACELFGCGTRGIDARNSRNVLLRNSVIRDCTLNVLYTQSSYNVQLDNCEIYNCGEEGLSLFSAYNSEHVVVSNSRIYDNSSRTLLLGTYCANLALLGNEVRDNTVETAVFAVGPGDVIVEGCRFTDNRIGQWFADESMSGSVYNQRTAGFGGAVDLQGNTLGVEDLEKMELRQVVYSVPSEAEAEERTAYAEVTVKTVDELLAAIAPNTKILLDGEEFDLSTASDYGSGSSGYYYWHDPYDGPELVIRGVDNLSIQGWGKDETRLAAIPRYANVLRFEDCQGISLAGFTAGHTEEPGACSGGVLYFENSASLQIADCGLFGCGTIGINAHGCMDMAVLDTEIYDCSVSGFNLYHCQDVRFENCDLHDLPSGAAHVNCEKGQVSFDGEVLLPGAYLLHDDGSLRLAEEHPYRGQTQEYQPAPTPMVEGFGIWSGDVRLMSEVTMKVTDYNIALWCGDSPTDENDEGTVWTVSDPESLQIAPWGNSCTVRVLKAVKGGVLLTASRGEEQAQLLIYCVE